MARFIQNEYSYYQQKGYPGQIARPGEPMRFELGKLHVATGGANPRPGEPVVWDATNNAFVLSSGGQDRRNPVGIISYDIATVQKQLSSTPSGANSDQFIEYEDDDVVKICLEGTLWVVAGSAVEFGQRVQYMTDDRRWDAFTGDLIASSASTVTTLRGAVNTLLNTLSTRAYPYCLSTAVTAGDLMLVKVGG